MQWIWTIVLLLLLFGACKQNKYATEYPTRCQSIFKNNKYINKFSSCSRVFQAEWRGDEYCLILFKDSSYVWYKSTGERTFSWGPYQEDRKGWKLASFIDATKEIPLVVKESYDSTLTGTLIRSHGWSYPSFFPSGIAWMGSSIATISIDKDTIQLGEQIRHLKCSNKETIDSTKILSVRKHKKILTLHHDYTIKMDNSIEEATYSIKKGDNNVFDCFFLRFHSGDFQIFNSKTAYLQKKKLLFPASILNGHENSTEMIPFNRIKKMPHSHPSIPPSEMLALSLHCAFSGAGRSILLDSIKFD